MFGFVAAYPPLLTEAQMDRYKACYCGLCRTLHERHGLLSRLTLTYDMTFLILLLSSLYEPEESCGEESCIAHPFKKHEYWTNKISAYAADMNVALAYLNCRDDWDDDCDPVSLAESKLLESAYKKVCAEYPRQCAAMQDSIVRLNEIEKTWEERPDEASRCFGSLMAELFAYRDDDYWNARLRAFGMYLGQFIYIMDACIDLRDDKRYYRYNPMRSLFNTPHEKERFSDILQMLIAQCVKEFEALPLEQDAELIQNILCFGIWNKFNKHYNIKPRENKGAVPDGSGPL